MNYTPFLSLIIPGLGQFLQKSRWRGITIFLIAPVIAFLTQWAFALPMKIGQIGGKDSGLSWLWLPVILFWIWNVWDSIQISKGKRTITLAGVFLAAVVLYVIAWSVTDVKLERLVTRFSDAQLVARELVNPDLITQKVNNEDRLCSWDCLGEYISDTLAGRAPKGPIQPSINVEDIVGRTEKKEASQLMVLLGQAKEGEEVAQFIPGKLFETVAIGLLATLFSTIVAIPISFFAAHNIMSRVPGGQVIYYVMRTLLNIVRAVDTVVWGLLVIVWVGLGSFAGVIALTIHSIAALGKLYSEEIEHIDPGPVEAVTAAGGNFWQVVRYAVIPQITPPFLAYTLLRWDINMRSATVIGFVAGGGIGFFVVETIRMGGYQQYAAALWFVAVVIILVDYLSARWRENILKDQPADYGKAKRPFYKNPKAIIYSILGVALFIVSWNITRINLADLFAPAPTFLRLLGDFLSFDFSEPVLYTVTKDLLTTIFQALLATTFGGILAIPFSFLAAKNLTGRSRLSKWIYYLTRSVFNVLRSIEALLYVAIFVFWVGIGPFAGTLALAVTTFALLGKLFSEAIENIETGPIEAVNATGANLLQMINYAILPQIVPPFISYLIYQWDINIRMATIIGFAGGGGIGLTLSMFFGMLQYHKAGTVVLFIVFVVAMMDFASAKLREKLV